MMEIFSNSKFYILHFNCFTMIDCNQDIDLLSGVGTKCFFPSADLMAFDGT